MARVVTERIEIKIQVEAADSPKNSQRTDVKKHDFQVFVIFCEKYAKMPNSLFM
jgi:hypothetical protein